MWRVGQNHVSNGSWLWTAVQILIECVVNVCIVSAIYFSVEDIVQIINKSLDMGTPEETHSLIQRREGMFPKVLPRSAYLYHDGLFKAKQQAVQVRVDSRLIKYSEIQISLTFQCLKQKVFLIPSVEYCILTPLPISQTP